MSHRHQPRDEQHHLVLAGVAHPVLGGVFDEEEISLGEDELDVQWRLLGRSGAAAGHSYGGAVITNAATNARNVVGLVYVAAFAPDEGETLLAIEGDSKNSVLHTVLVPLQFPPHRPRG